MKIKRIVIILSLILILSILTSCSTEQEELEDIAIVVATGLDMEDEELILTVEIVIPLNRVEESGTTNSIILQEKGDTVMEAIRNITLNFDRKLYFPHNTVIIFGEELAKRGISNYLDFFTRDNEPRENAYLVVAKGLHAYELIGINSSLVGTSGEYIQAMIENTIYTLKGRTFTINEFFKYYYHSKTPLLGIVEKIHIVEIEPMTGKIGSKDVIDVRGGAAFYKDQLQDYYNSDQMIGFNFIVDEVEEGIIVFQVPKELTEYSDVFTRVGDFTTFEIVKSKTKKNIEIKNGKPFLNISVNVKGFIVEDNMGLNTNQLEIKDQVEIACQEQIKKHIDLALKKGQELKLDSFSINHLFHMTYPKEYKKIENDWQNVFTKMDYSIDVNVDIIRTGLTNSPTNIIRGEDY